MVELLSTTEVGGGTVEKLNLLKGWYGHCCAGAQGRGTGGARAGGTSGKPKDKILLGNFDWEEAGF